MLSFILFWAFASPGAQAQLLGRIPVELVITNNGSSGFAFPDHDQNSIDLGRHQARLLSFENGRYVLEFNKPILLRLHSTTSHLPVTKMIQELKVEMNSIDFMSLEKVLSPQSEALVSFEIFDDAAITYLNWYLGSSLMPPPLSRPKLYRLQGLHFTISIQKLFTDGYIFPDETNASYREVIDPQGTLSSQREIKPLSFWEMRIREDPLVHQILIVASGEKELDSSSPFYKSNDQRGRLLAFRRSCRIPISGKDDD